MGRVRVKTVINNSTGPTGGTFFTLVLSIVREADHGFDASVVNMTPEACLLYRRNLEGDDYFEGVCTLNQFLTYGTDTDKEYYRKSSFVQEYSDYNTPVSDQTEMLGKIDTFYNNLNTYINSYVDIKQSAKEFTVPDYTQEKLDKLISQWRSVKNSLLACETELNVKEKIYYPSLEAVATLADQVKSSIDQLETAKEEYSGLFSDISGARTQLEEAVKSSVEASADVVVNVQYVAALQDQIDTVRASLDQAASHLTPDNADPSDTIQTNQSVAVMYNALKLAKLGAANTQVSLHDLRGKVVAVKSAIQPVCKRLPVFAQDAYSPSETIDTLTTAMLALLTELKFKKAECESEMNKLKAQIEEHKSAMQMLESQMRRIRPSIDMSNPESAWYFTVNIS